MLFWLIKCIYAPKCKYGVRGYPRPLFSKTTFQWVPSVLGGSLDEVEKLAGTDATTFLYFLHLIRWCMTIVAVMMCLVLIPIDLSYNLSRGTATPEAQSYTEETSQSSPENYLLYITMSQVDGPRLWAHVVLSYVATIVCLALVYIYYKKVIALRQNFFTSEQYQKSFYSRALMITDIPSQYQSIEGLHLALTNAKIPYPFSEVQIGHDMQALSKLLERQNQLVYKLEKLFNRMLRRKQILRPKLRLSGTLYNTLGGVKVDAIDYYSEELRTVERQIQEARSDKAEQVPTSYGFASLAAVPYAHTIAKNMCKSRPLGMRIRLASSPQDILWSNLMKSPKQRAHSKTLGVLYFVLLFLANLLPLLLVALISNMNSFAINDDFLEVWQSNSSFTFAAVEAIVPPLISLSFALALPILMRRISMYRGVRTRESRNITLCDQYFSFLILTHFLFFSLISVFLDVTVYVIGTVHHHDGAGQVLSQVWEILLDRIAMRFQGLSGYWMTWIILKGYMQLFELAQIARLIFVWLHKHIALRTPRELYEFARPPDFQYWVYYAELMFLAAIGVIYAPLAPIISAFVAAVFWMASFVYKYQFIFVYRTKSETGGRLWSIAINRFLVTIGSMQIIVAIVIGINQSWVKAVACIPPVLFVAVFRIYCHLQLEPKFLWYTPSAMDLAKTKVHVHDSDRQRLARQFGHPFLHEPLLTPIVYADMVNRLKRFYSGPVESSNVLQLLDSDENVEDNAIGMGNLDPKTATFKSTSLDEWKSTDTLVTAQGKNRFLPNQNAFVNAESLDSQPPTFNFRHKTSHSSFDSELSASGKPSLSYNESYPFSLSIHQISVPELDPLGGAPLSASASSLSLDRRPLTSGSQLSKPTSLTPGYQSLYNQPSYSTPSNFSTADLVSLYFGESESHLPPENTFENPYEEGMPHEFIPIDYPPEYMTETPAESRCEPAGHTAHSLPRPLPNLPQ